MRRPGAIGICLCTSGRQLWRSALSSNTALWNLLFLKGLRKTFWARTSDRGNGGQWKKRWCSTWNKGPKSAEGGDFEQNSVMGSSGDGQLLLDGTAALRSPRQGATCYTSAARAHNVDGIGGAATLFFNELLGSTWNITGSLPNQQNPGTARWKLHRWSPGKFGEQLLKHLLRS